MRVVIDSNVVVCAFMRPESPPGLVLDLWRSRHITAVFSLELSEEILGVIGRKHLERAYSRPEVDVAFFAAAIRLAGVRSCPPMGAPRYPRDRHVLGAAVGLTAEVIVVSGDDDLLVLESFEGIPIVNPRAFLDGLDELAASAP